MGWFMKFMGYRAPCASKVPRIQTIENGPSCIPSGDLTWEKNKMIINNHLNHRTN